MAEQTTWRHWARGRACALAALAGMALCCLFAVQPAAGGGGPDNPAFGYGGQAREARPVRFCDIYLPHKSSYDSCLARQLLGLIVKTGDPARELPRIDHFVHLKGGYLEANCHILMHTVGRNYGRVAKVTLTRLQDYLPRTNDSGCSAGFAHGVITYLGPQIVRFGPKGAVAICRGAPTRYQRYSCVHGLGHAYMRLFSDTFAPALEACRAVGPADAADCAQGAYMDYWMSLAGSDGARRPAAALTSRRAVCAKAPRDFVRACWYRAFSDHPPAKPIASASALVRACRGLDSFQRSGCLSGGALVLSVDPFEQLAVCGRLEAAEAASCIRGVRVPAVALVPLRIQVRLVRECADVARGAQGECYSWLGEALNVVTNGRFEASGCPRLRYAATRAACSTGARAYQGALETFS